MALVAGVPRMLTVTGAGPTDAPGAASGEWADVHPAPACVVRQRSITSRRRFQEPAWNPCVRVRTQWRGQFVPGIRAADGAFRRLVACWTVAMREVCGETPCSASVLTDVGRVKAAVGRHREPAPRAARPAILTLGDTASDDDAETQRSK